MLFRNDILSILGLDLEYTFKYTPLPSGNPWASPSGTSSDKGVYLNVYPSSHSYTDTVQYNTIMQG